MKPQAIISSNPIQAWDKLDYEDSEMYNAFAIYLSLKPPRSIRAAFIKYLEIVKGLKKEDALLTPLSPQYINWSNGYDYNNNLPDGFYTWQQRASAYDDEQFRDYKNQLKGSQIDTVYREIRDVDMLETHWETIYSEMITDFDKRRKDSALEGRQYDNTFEAQRLAEMLNIREKIALFKRRAVMLPSKYDNAENTLDKIEDNIILWKDK